MIAYGELYTKQGLYDKALNQYVRALNLAKKRKNDREIAIAWNGIGIIHWKEGKNQSALNAYNRSLSIRERIKDSVGIAESYSNLGIIYKIRGSFSNAQTLYFKSLGIRQRLNDEEGIAKVLFNIGSLKAEMGFPKEALIYYDKAFEIKKKLKDTYGILPHYLNSGDVFRVLKDYTQSEKNYLKGLQISDSIGAKDYIMSFNRELAKLYGEKKDYQTAYFYHIKYMAAKDQIINVANLVNLSELQLKYNTSEKQRNIQQLKFEKKLNLEKIQKAVLIRNIVIGLFVFVLGIFGIVLYKDRLLKRTNLLLVEQKRIIEQREKEKEMLSREMHHRVKNNLQLTSSLLNLQARRVNDFEANQALKDARNRIQTISLIHQKLYGFGDLSEINLADYLPDLCKSILSSNIHPACTISFCQNIEQIIVSIDQSISIGLFVNEAIINSIKHAFDTQTEGKIELNVQLKDGSIFLSILDDGIGFPENVHNEDFGGFGFQLLRSFSTKLGARMKLESEKGSKISIHIPYQNA